MQVCEAPGDSDGMEVEAMKCPQCGHQMRTALENYLYKECGLPNVTLVEIEVSRCPKCGEHEAVIPKIEQLHRVIATMVARKVPRLTEEEIRFLRKYLGWSGGDFADHMGVSPETVSRWENGSAAMGPSAERLLRLAALTREPASDYSLDVLKEVAQKKPAAQRLQVRVQKGSWSAEAA
jgi:putative zinc finger/helix-turn-helix YgiT family protein